MRKEALLSEGKNISSATPNGSCCKRTKIYRDDQRVEDREVSERAQKIEKEQRVAIRARSERRWRRFIAERGGKIEERVSKFVGEMKPRETTSRVKNWGK